MKKIAVFGAGCFWYVQEVFDTLNVKTEVGYMGGDEEKYPNPSYEEVCSNKTGFAEVIKIEFDDEKISYNSLLDFFWKMHDPTSLNRQGNDYGTQYRSVIFYFDGQKETAEKSLEMEQINHEKKIVTEIVPAKKFFRAEEYNQKYNQKRSLNLS